MIKRIKLVSIFCMFFSLFVFFSICQAELPEERFAKRVLNLVLKKDVNQIYLMTTQEFKRSTSLEELKNMVNKVLNLYKGKITKISLEKFNRHSKLNISELWLKVEYNDGLWMYFGLFLKRTDNKFKILGLRFNMCPQVASKAIQSYPYYKEVLNFCKDVFSYIKEGDTGKVMDLISEEIKNKIGVEFIKNFLNSIKGSEVKKLINFKWNNIENGYWYHLIFEGVLKNSDVKMEIILIRTQGRFKIIDINYTK